MVVRISGRKWASVGRLLGAYFMHCGTAGTPWLPMAILSGCQVMSSRNRIQPTSVRVGSSWSLSYPCCLRQTSYLSYDGRHLRRYQVGSYSEVANPTSNDILHLRSWFVHVYDEIVGLGEKSGSGHVAALPRFTRNPLPASWNNVSNRQRVLWDTSFGAESEWMPSFFLELKVAL